MAGDWTERLLEQALVTYCRQEAPDGRQHSCKLGKHGKKEAANVKRLAKKTRWGWVGCDMSLLLGPGLGGLLGQVWSMLYGPSLA